MEGKMSEKFANIIVGDESYDATRENTTVYNHFGMGELYDHVYVDINDTQGVYIWKEQPPNNPLFTTLAAIAVQHGAETHVNIRKVAEGDLRAFGKAATRDLDERPDWLP